MGNENKTWLKILVKKSETLLFLHIFLLQWKGGQSELCNLMKYWMVEEKNIPQRPEVRSKSSFQ